MLFLLSTGEEGDVATVRDWVHSMKRKNHGVLAWKIGYGNGHFNAGGTHVVTILLLAKQCGADVNDSLLHRTLVHFYRATS